MSEEIKVVQKPYDLCPHLVPQVNKFARDYSDVSTVREAIRTEIRTELSETVTSRDELEEEWNDLFGT